MAYHRHCLALATLLLGASALPSAAQTVQSTVTLLIGGDAQQRSLAYDCGEFGQITVRYIDAAPNFLALVPYEDNTLIFAAVMGDPDVRYASSNYQWSTTGTTATFTDLTAAKDAPPLAACTEISNTP